MKNYFTILITIFIFTHTSYGQEINTDRPDQTESSRVLSRKTFQIESGFLFEESTGVDNSIQTMNVPTTLFRIGLFSRVELRIVNQLEFKKILRDGFSSNILGFRDIDLGTKIQLLKKKGNNSEIAFLQHVSLPTGSHNMTANTVGINSKLLVSHSVGENFGIGYNIGYSYLNSIKGDVNYSLAFSIGLHKKLSIYIEPYGSIIEMEEFLLNFDGGFAFLVKDNFQLDFSFGTGVTHTMNYLSFGCSWYISKDY